MVNKPAQTVMIKYDRRFLVLGNKCWNSPDLCSPVWFSFRLKPTAWPTNWNQIQSQLACIDPYLTSRLGMDWYWLTIKPLAGMSRDLLNMLNEKVSYLCPSMNDKRNSSTCKTTAELGLYELADIVGNSLFTVSLCNNNNTLTLSKTFLFKIFIIIIVFYIELLAQMNGKYRQE